jgi:hypothetical protein
MGGRGSGGRRVGSGAKRKSAIEHAITGTIAAGPRGVVLTHPSAPDVAPIETFDPPASLRGKARGVWLALAPSAFEARTLTRATEVAFVILCRNVALEQKLASGKYSAGRANHRGMIQRVDAELTKFCLSPFGKPTYAAQPVAPANPLERFTKTRA